MDENKIYWTDVRRRLLEAKRLEEEAKKSKMERTIERIKETLRLKKEKEMIYGKHIVMDLGGGAKNWDDVNKIEIGPVKLFFEDGRTETLDDVNVAKWIYNKYTGEKFLIPLLQKQSTFDKPVSCKLDSGTLTCESTTESRREQNFFITEI
jgi:hypothetical protein